MESEKTQIVIRVTEQAKESYKESAKLEDKTLTEFMKMAANERVKKNKILHSK
jgi:uncharacterized protein (DUF1778 family)